MKIKELINKYYNELKAQNLNKEVNVPDEMKVSEGKNGWSEWKIGESLLDKNEVEKFFKKSGLNIPSDYKEYLTCCQFFDIEENGYKIFGVNKRDGVERLIFYTSDKLLKNGYLTIGNYEDYDYIVLNTKTGEIELFDYDTLKKKKDLGLFKDFIYKLVQNSGKDE